MSFFLVGRGSIFSSFWGGWSKKEEGGGGQTFFLGQVMSLHHSDQISQRSKVSRVTLIVSGNRASKGQGHLLSCSGQLKRHALQKQQTCKAFAQRNVSKIYQES